MAIQVDLIVSGLAAPTFATSAPGVADELFITERGTGRVVVLDLGTNQVSAQAFFDVPAAEMSTSGEGGLLGLAFHPDYAANGKAYLHLTNESGDAEIWEITRSAADPAVADPASARVLLTIERTATNHVGGWIGFGPDGLLYIASGDSGGGGDPENAAQDVNDLRGKILRMDVSTENPEVFAYGLRNPWRASFDRATGDLYIGDVGERTREEIDFLAAGSEAGTNFGWRVMEGTVPTGYPQLDNPPPNDPSFTAPIYEYGRADGGTVIGGYVYRGPGGLQGEYFFADFLSDHVWTARVVDGEVVEVTQRDSELVFVNGGTLDMMVSFAEDAQGRLYVMGLDGELFRLTPSAATPPNPGQTITGTSGNDTLSGTAGDDTINGLGGNDLFLAGSTGGNDRIDGGAGSDSIEFRERATSAVVVDFVAGTISGGSSGTISFMNIERVVAGNFNDSLSGNGSSQTLTGYGGADTLWGAGGGDTLWGSNGADTFVFRETGTANADRINDFASGSDKILLDASAMSALGASGNFASGDDRFVLNSAQDAEDRIVFNTTTKQVFYDADGSGSGGAVLIATLQSSATLAATDIVVEGGSAPEGGQTINGTPGNDSLVGGAGDDTINGFAGDDTLIGLGGDDTLINASGFDTVDGGPGFDTEITSGGIAGAGIERMILRGYEAVGIADGHGNELNNIIIDEGPGQAFLYGNGGNDTLVGGSGVNFFVFVGNPSGSSDAYGHDSVDGGGNIDWLLFEGNGGAVTVDFRNGTVTGGSSLPASVTFVNVEVAQGTLLNDVMFASDSGNHLRGYGGDDTLTGGAGADTIIGDDGFDHPPVGPGNDRLLGGGGNDRLSGGEGADTFAFTVAPGAANADTINDFSSADDQLVLDGTVHASSGPSGTFAAGDARFWSSTTGMAHDSDDRLIYNTSTGELWYDTNGDAAGGRELVATLEGAPSLAATDIEIVNGSTTPPPGGQVINGTSGNDTLTGTSGNDTISGLGGNDLFLAGSTGGNDVLDGGTGHDSLEFRERATSAVVVDFGAGSISGGTSGTISFSNVERVVAGNFNDSLSGNASTQTLTGFGGSDTLWGAGGADTLWGSSGADTFIFREMGTTNADRISDWASGSDTVALDNAAMGALGPDGDFAAGDARFVATSTGTAQDTSDRVVFDTSTGRLYYDADGSGSGAAQLIATVQTGASVAATDIVVI